MYSIGEDVVVVWIDDNMFEKIPLFRVEVSSHSWLQKPFAVSLEENVQPLEAHRLSWQP